MSMTLVAADVVERENLVALASQAGHVPARSLVETEGPPA